MRIVPNTGTDRVVDIIRPWLRADNRVDLVSRTLSLFAFAELAGNLLRLGEARLVLPPDDSELDLLGSEADRAARNRLQGRWLASRCAAWIEKAAEVRRANGSVPQGAIVLRNGDGRAGQALIGSFSFSTDGLGLAPDNPLNLIQASETPDEGERLGAWFDAQWSTLTEDPAATAALVDALRGLATHRAPSSVYAAILHHLFRTEGGGARRRAGRQVGNRDSRYGSLEAIVPFPARRGHRRHRQARTIRRLHHRGQRRARQDVRGTGDHQVPRTLQ